MRISLTLKLFTEILISAKVNSGKVLILFLLLLLAPSCKKTATFDNFGGFAQGTTYSVTFANKGNIDPQELKSEIEKILKEFDLSLSLYADSSILSRVNRNEDVQVDRYFSEAFRKSVEISELSGGAFDITVGPLTRAWGFGPEDYRNFSESKLDSLLKLIGMEKVRLENNRVIKTDPAIKFDFNAIAQGYSVDVVSEYLDSRGIRNSLVEIGGEVRAMGDKSGVLWRIGIDRPEDNNNMPGNNLQAVISMKDRSLATSGNYRKFYVEDGVKYSHTIDPRTGYPARNTLLSATILADDCATADGIATACMVIGKDQTIEFLGEHPEYDALLIYSDESGNFMTWSTDNLKKFISQ
jgi:thiamine biosynthesis lipoprotein